MDLLVKNDDICRGVGVCCNDAAIVSVTVVVFVVCAAVELVPVRFSAIKTDVVASFSFVPHNHWQFSFMSFSLNTVLAKLFDGLIVVSDVLGVAQVCTVEHSIDLFKWKKRK